MPKDTRVVIGWDVFGTDNPQAELTRAELEQAIDADLDRFERFFIEELGNNGGLTPYERSTIKTYMHYKLFSGGPADESSSAAKAPTAEEENAP